MKKLEKIKGMIKGVNKQIIEMKCTNSEYFDKVLLFVNPKNYGLSSDFLKRQAEKYTEGFDIDMREKKNGSGKLFFALTVICLLIVAALIWAIISLL